MRVWLERDVQLRSETREGVMLQGRTRLIPGRIVEVIRTRATGPPEVRRALVRTWQVHALGSAGPVYRGFCAWQ